MLAHEFASMRLMAGPASLLVQFVRITSFSGGTNVIAQYVHEEKEAAYRQSLLHKINTGAVNVQG